jgi:redox-sensitive bicupin YhaK (pirin superfamily)
MQAGRGMWHGGGLDKAGRTRGFQLWIALPPALELGPTISIYQPSGDVQSDGPARVLLGSYGSASSAIASPSPINYLAVRLKAGERWRYEPPTALMAAVGPQQDLYEVLTRYYRELATNFRQVIEKRKAA